MSPVQVKGALEELGVVLDPVIMRELVRPMSLGPGWYRLSLLRTKLPLVTTALLLLSPDSGLRSLPPSPLLSFSFRTITDGRRKARVADPSLSLSLLAATLAWVPFASLLGMCEIHPLPSRNLIPKSRGFQSFGWHVAATTERDGRTDDRGRSHSTHTILSQTDF